MSAAALLSSSLFCSNYSNDFSNPEETVLRILQIEVPFVLAVDGDHTFEGPVP